MEITIIKGNDKEIAVVNSSDVLIEDVQSALEFLATIQYETGCDRNITEVYQLSC